jgi:hypothetical protein
VIQKSFQDGHLKDLDYKLVKSFRHAATRRLYRHLDKHFYPQKKHHTLTYDVKTLAFQHIGMTQRKNVSAIKDALEPAIMELEEAGYICKAPESTRFRKVGPGSWNVSFTLKICQPKRIQNRQQPVRKQPRTPVVGRCPVEGFMEGLDANTRRQVEEEALENNRIAADIRKKALAAGNTQRAESMLQVALKAYVLRMLNAEAKSG